MNKKKIIQIGIIIITIISSIYLIVNYILLDYYNKIYYTKSATLTKNINNFRNSNLFKSLLIGKEGWIFDEDNLTYCNKILNEEELEKLYKLFYERKEWLRSYNIDYYLAIVPRKATIYPEYTANLLIQKEKLTILDQLIQRNNKESNPLKIVDFRKSLLDQKLAEPDIILYRPCDTHWSDYGAYFAYRYLMEYMGISPLPLSKYEIIEKETFCDGDLKNLIGIFTDAKIKSKFINLKKEYDIVKINAFSDIVYESKNDDNNLKNVFVIRDSFLNQFIHSFAQHFHKAMYFKIFDKLVPEYITEQDYRIDACIHELGEKYLSWNLQENYPVIKENSITNIFEKSTYKLLTMQKEEIQNITIDNTEDNKLLIPFSKLSFDNNRESIIKLKVYSNQKSKMRIVEKNTTNSYLGLYDNVEKDSHSYYLAIPANFNNENYFIEIDSNDSLYINSLEIRAKEKEIPVYLINTVRTKLENNKFYYSKGYAKDYSILQYKLDDKDIKENKRKIKIYVRGQCSKPGSIEIYNGNNIDNLTFTGKFINNFEKTDLYEEIFYIDSPLEAKYLEIRFKGGNGWTNIYDVKAFLY